MSELSKEVFKPIYQKYYNKDYFGIRECLKNKLRYAKENNIKVKISDVKQYLKGEKAKCFIMLNKRISEYVNEKKQYPKREKLTWEVFNKLNLTVKG